MPLMHQLPESDLQRLLAEEPFVRALARQLIVDDADEVVQQTWLKVLQQGSLGVDRPRHWLARIARNVVANLRRGDRRRQNRQRRVSRDELVPSSAELMQREERRHALVAAVDSLPPALRTVVLLRWFDGLPPRRIAADLGVPAATVSTQLNRALQLLRERLDQDHDGDRRSWLLSLVPFAARPTGLPLPVPSNLPVLLTGVIAMTTKAKFVAAVAGLLAVVGAWMMWPDEGPSARLSSVPSVPGESRAAQADLPQPSKPEVAAAAAPQRQSVPEPSVATTGALVVHARYGDDRAPAAGVMLTLCRPRSDPRFDGRRQHTDEGGTARFDPLPPGRHYVACQSGDSKRIEIVAGQTTELDYVLKIGLTVNGVVVDDAGVPVAGALVEVTWMAQSDVYPEVVATSGADGRFTARASPPYCLVGARAAGYTASPVRFLLGKDGNTADIRLVVGKNGGCVEGLVVDLSGKPVADAVVIIGKGELSGIGGRDHIPPFPGLTRSDADGRFRAVGIPAGEQPVQTRALAFAPWQGRVEVAAGLTVPLRITLGPGATIHGLVRNIDGAPVGGAEVEIGAWADLAHYRCVTTADGTFDFAGVPEGELLVRAQHDDLGKGTKLINTAAGTTTVCELQLSRGLELVGRVVDDTNKPVPSASLECMADRGGWFAFAKSDAQGRFTAANCPETGSLRVTTRADQFEELLRTDVDPKAGELVLQLRRALPRSVHIVGTVVGPDGKPVANAIVEGTRQGSRDRSGGVTDDSGRFDLGPVTPGVWQIWVRSPTHPEFNSEARELAPDATWDLGTIALQAGGSAVVHRQGSIAGATLLVVNAANSRASTLGEEGGQLRSSVLAPGDYHLLVSGDGVAAQAVPFKIRAAEETSVEVRLLPGVLQQFEITLPPVSTATDGVQIRVKQGTSFVGRTWAAVRPGEPVVAKLCLLPGEYAWEANHGELRGAGTFTVGATPGTPVRIELR